MNEKDFANALLAAMLLGEEKAKPTNKADLRKKSKELGDLLMQTYLGFMDAGFTSEQAITLTAAIARRQ